MKISIIRKLNKYLISISIISLTISIFSILTIAATDIDTQFFNFIRIVTISLLFIGVVCLVVNLMSEKKIDIDMSEFESIIVNSKNDIDQIVNEGQIENLGNKLRLVNGNEYEIGSKQTFSLLESMNRNAVSVIIESKPLKYYQLNPKKVLSFLLQLGS